jgi:hypothetical protein
LAAASLLVPAAAFLWLLSHPTADSRLVIPYQHFYLVGAVSLLAFGLVSGPPSNSTLRRDATS